MAAATALSRRRPRPSRAAQYVSSSSQARCMALSMLAVATLYICLLFQAQSVLDHQQGVTSSSTSTGLNLFRLPQLANIFGSSTSKKHLRMNNSKPYRFMGDLALENEERARRQHAAAAIDSDSRHRFIIFLPIQHGQGLGNIISGLLSAHLLGEEFDRIVCVSPDYADFRSMFDPTDERVIQYCPSALQQSHNQSAHAATGSHVRLVTFEPAPNECRLQKQLRDGPDILFLTGNTYPRWPRIPLHSGGGYFSKYYRPTRKLLQALPWKATSNNDAAPPDNNQLLDAPPTTVVHLRQADGAQDMRKGLDATTLHALGKSLPSDTYLVTNRVSWYDYFHTEFGWKHPPWNSVIHSALHKQWGSRQRQHDTSNDENGNASNHNAAPDDAMAFQTVQEDDRERQRQQLQMWADWYTISQATTVWHTHSDFSISAIHWNDIRDSKTILGYNADKQSLILVDESWRVDGETAALKDRTELASGTARLRLCGHRAD